MTATPSPQVSVIIPSYNYARYLPDAINSALAQKVEKGVEIIVVDDGSSDNTAQVAQAYGGSIRYIYQDNQGLSAARNTGMEAARGEFMVFLDADDLLVGGNLNSHLAKFASAPQLDISVCHSIQVGEGNSKPYLWQLKSDHLDLHFCEANISPVHTFMMRSAAARDTGYFDSSFEACEDYDFWLRCAAGGKTFAANPNGFVIYRQHGSSMTTQRKKQLAYDSAIRFKIGKFLETLPEFPRAGKFYGWLVYAAGCLSSAYGMSSFNVKYSGKLLEESASALLKAAACAPKSAETDPYLINVERYYSAIYLALATSFENQSSETFRRATAFLARRNNSFAALNPKTKAGKIDNLFSRIICKPPIIPEITIK